MKIIEALKQTKYLKRKLEDLRVKISNHCVDMDCDTPVYPDQKGQVQKWIQMFGDTVKEIGRLKHCLNRTNIETKVSVQIDEKSIEKSIAEWIIRRRELIELEKRCWMVQDDGRFPAQQAMKRNDSGEQFIANIRRYYDPVVRDKRLALLGEEPTLIDSTLEIANATTDLIE